MTAPDIRDLSHDGTLVVAPIAACEQHGPHLPVFTDSILCGAVADGIEQALPDQILLLPVLWLGASEHHLPFGGTLTATISTYTNILVDLLTPLLRNGFRRFLLLNGHGGNLDPLHVALRRLDVLFPRALLTGAAYWELAEAELAELCHGPLKSMGHACEMETSMMLHLRPDLARRDLIRNDFDPSRKSIPGLMRAQDFGRCTSHGVIGFPENADPRRGRLMLESVIQKVVVVARRLLELPLEE